MPKKPTKVEMVKTLVWTALLYGSEAWTLGREDIGKLEGLEMWLWRRMEKISWTDKITNEEVLEGWCRWTADEWVETWKEELDGTYSKRGWFANGGGGRRNGRRGNWRKAETGDVG
jgi:hypothetical protein